MWHKKQKRIYFDNSASTPIDKIVLDQIFKINKIGFANPNSLHKEGLKAFSVLENSRKQIAKNIGSLSDEIIFTSGGTESNNLAILGTINYVLEKSNKNIGISDLHFISTEIEHPSIKFVLKHISRLGGQVDFLSVNEKGDFNINNLREKINSKTLLISLSLGNSEIGVISDIKSVMKTVRYFRKINNTEWPFVHLDASQGFLLDINVKKLGIDFLVLDGQKIYGPKGVGILYKKRSVPLSSVFYGGHQENSFRPGTENVSLIAGFSKALEIVVKNRQLEFDKILSLQNFLWREIKKEFSNVILNGPDLDENRLPGNLNISLVGNDRELIVLRFDAKGISISAGSACQKSEESYVLQAITNDDKRIKSAIRISLGRFNKKSECRKFIKILKKITKI